MGALGYLTATVTDSGGVSCVQLSGRPQATASWTSPGATVTAQGLTAASIAGAKIIAEAVSTGATALVSWKSLAAELIEVGVVTSSFAVLVDNTEIVGGITVTISVNGAQIASTPLTATVDGVSVW